MTLSSNYQKSIGLDFNLSMLIIAKKKIEQENIKNIILVCGEAEYLPFNNSAFDLVNMSNTIEHVVSVRKTLIESRRVINNNGIVFFDSPNRFCLNRPEPHVRIWGVGFMPRKWMHRYVKIMSGNSIQYYRLINYHLLSLFELRRILIETFGRNYKIINYIADESFSPRTIIGRIFRKYKTINKLFNSFPLNVFVPDQHFVIAWKQLADS